jgi:hypothetical protein
MLKSQKKEERLGDRVNRALTDLLLLGAAPGVDPSRDTVSSGSGGHGKHGTTSVAPSDMQPLVLEWAEFFRRAVELAELDVAMERGQHPRPHMVKRGRVSAMNARERDHRIARSRIYEGRRPEFVAYAEGCSVDTVKTARTAAHLDPLTGERERRARPLTAPMPH